MSASLTSSYEGGSGTSKSYQYNSTGSYKFTVHNVLESGNTALDTTITITVPSTGSGIAAEMTGAAVLSGDFLSGATVTYSTDGGLTYDDESSISNWSEVTNIMITMAGGVALSSGEAAYVTVPFAVRYGVSA
ncbi:MAG: hypothetical protein WBI55_05025 [Eubacteriales bacterium]|nr:hypothetical protein [Clostridiales bacterium]